MKNFEEITSNKVRRLTEKEEECLYGHDPDDDNGVFKLGKLFVIATTEHSQAVVTEHVSISHDDLRRPNPKEIEMVKRLFWNPDEMKDVYRLPVSSNVIHLECNKLVYSN